MLLNPTEYDDDLNNESDRFNKVIILNKDVISNIDGQLGENNLTTKSRGLRKSDNNFQKKKKP